MNWRDVSEIVAILAIVVSLLLLTYELNRSNELAEAEAIAYVHTESNALMQQMVGDKDMIRIWTEGLADYESLPDEMERKQFLMLLWMTFNSYEIAYKYYDKGILQEEDAAFYAQDLCNLLSESTVRFWHDTRRGRLPGFYNYVNKNCNLSVP